MTFFEAQIVLISGDSVTCPDQDTSRQGDVANEL